MRVREPFEKTQIGVGIRVAHGCVHINEADQHLPIWAHGRAMIEMDCQIGVTLTEERSKAGQTKQQRLEASKISEESFVDGVQTRVADGQIVHVLEDVLVEETSVELSDVTVVDFERGDARVKVRAGDGQVVVEEQIIDAGQVVERESVDLSVFENERTGEAVIFDGVRQSDFSLEKVKELNIFQDRGVAGFYSTA